MLYKFDNDKYELCKKYIMEVYDGNKKNVEMYDVSKSIIVSGNSVNDFMEAADYAIIHFGMINQDYLSDLGCKLQFLYDDIYRQTKINKKSEQYLINKGDTDGIDGRILRYNSYK